MLKILVADDEILARKAIVNILERSEIGFTVDREFDSGQLVLDYLHQTDGDADLLITDIRMLEMDGLEVAKIIQKNGWKTQVILISGYTEFTYAQQAIRYQVQQYLTKPLDRQALLDAVLDISKNKAAAQTAPPLSGRQMLDFFIEQFSLRDILRNPTLSGHLAGIAPKDASWQCYRTAILQINRKDETLQDRFHQAMQEFLFLHAPNSLLLYFPMNHEWVLVLFGPQESLTDTKMHQLLKSLFSSIRCRGAAQVSIGFSGITCGFKGLYISYKDSIFAINRRLLKGWNAVYLFRPPEECPIQNILTDGQKIGLKQALKLRRTEDATKILNAFFSDPALLSQDRIEPLYNGIMEILSIANQIYRSSNRDSSFTQSETPLFSRYYDLYQFYSIAELQKYILDIVENICQDETHPELKDSSIASKMIEYVETHYQYSISLQTLADQRFFMNASYLSRLFKMTTGKTFSQYIISLRMEKARDLLENSVLKISEIAAHVGYNDTSHFIKYFRKYFQTTPEEYRSRSLQKYASTS